jgi:hypothetical protein
MFWQKWKKEQEVLPESVFDRLDKLEKKMLRLNSEMLDVMTSVQILRDKVLKKIKFKKEEEEEEHRCSSVLSELGERQRGVAGLVLGSHVLSETGGVALLSVSD